MGKSQFITGLESLGCEQFMVTKMPRPTGVTVLGVLAILVGLLGIGGGAVLLLIPDLVIVTLSALAVVIGLLYLAAGIGFLRGIRWAWTLGLIVSIVSLIRNFTEIAKGGVAYGIPGVIVAALVIYYLTRPNVKVFFGRGSSPMAPSVST